MSNPYILRAILSILHHQNEMKTIKKIRGMSLPWFYCVLYVQEEEFICCLKSIPSSRVQYLFDAEMSFLPSNFLKLVYLFWLGVRIKYWILFCILDMSYLPNAAILYRLARGSGHIVDGDKSIVYSHKDLTQQGWLSSCVFRKIL